MERIIPYIMEKMFQTTTQIILTYPHVFPKKNKSAVATELLSRLVATEFQSASAGECERINYDIP